MKWADALVLGGLVALVMAAILASADDEFLPQDVWVIRTPDPVAICMSPDGAAVEHGSVAWSDAGISLWYEPSTVRRFLWRVGLGEPVDGADYEPSGRKQTTSTGTWHHYVRLGN